MIHTLYVNIFITDLSVCLLYCESIPGDSSGKASEDIRALGRSQRLSFVLRYIVTGKYFRGLGVQI
jgi:hypothetical protein